MVPSDPTFTDWLSIPPPNFSQQLAKHNGDCALVARVESGGAMEVIPWTEVDEYVWGGELDELDATYAD